MKHIKLMRTKHYIKNFLIFLPLFFGGKLFDMTVLVNAIFGFLSFSFISSVIYIINDIKDAPMDRNHPTKCNRPIASGAVGVKSALALAVVLLAISVLCAYMAGNDVTSYTIIAAYLVINISYSMGLKNVPIIDILLLVSGFVLRVLYGASVSGVGISDWMYLSVMSISFYLGFGKRRNEYKKQDVAQTRKVLKAYNYEFLDKFMYICLAIFIIFYSLWCTMSEIAVKSDNTAMFSIPIVMAIVMRYSLDVEGNNDGDPTEIILSDKWLICMGAVLVAFFAVTLY